MKELPSEIKELQGLVQQLLEKVASLEAENAELKRQLSRTSATSHMPPSSDGYKRKVKRAGLPKDKKASGGQKGHKGKTLTRSEAIDEVVYHLPACCESCGRQFGQEDKMKIIASRQVFDLPAVKLEVSEHRIVQMSCCGKHYQGNYPEDVSASVQYGAGVRALVSMMSTDYRLPLEKISQYFADIYGYELNSSTILASLARGYQLLVPTEDHIKACIKGAAYAHFDETSLRCENKRYWLHTASTPNYTHLFIHEKRGTEALYSGDSIIKDYQGFAVHDCWSSYFKFDCAHALCGAHLLRELSALIEQQSAWAAEMHDYLLTLYKQARPLSQQQQQASLKRFKTILKQADLEEPPPKQGKRGRPKLSTGRALLNRLSKHQDAVHAFAFVDDIPFTNNQAERDIRPAKVKQKVSGTFRAVLGAKTYARFTAFISTLRKQHINVFSALRDLFALKQAFLI